jgi:hypothetical protein
MLSLPRLIRIQDTVVRWNASYCVFVLKPKRKGKKPRCWSREEVSSIVCRDAPDKVLATRFGVSVTRIRAIRLKNINGARLLFYAQSIAEN